MTIETVLISFYVDNLLKFVTSEQEAVSLIKEMVNLMKAGGFRLTKFISNNEYVMKTIPEIGPSASFDSDIKERTLGIKWDVVRDIFIFESLTFEIEEVRNRVILKIVASTFDLLRFVSPFVLTVKIFLQELWRMKAGWDTIIDDNAKRKWKKWQGEQKNVSGVEIARAHHQKGYIVSCIEPHVSCDASEKAYGAVVYLKF